ncbi:epoxide hydrolase family protein [Jatrophihabitans sp.]|uniref:epoxide hydrolase family protein n=1 Tax=Jatrophihabitans sp. TaxID=1932789 RepID=UPI0030C6C503|nr:epocide hydrolase protein [Jatrophihabitans sp.]
MQASGRQGLGGQPPIWHVSQAELDELRARLRAVRWPMRWPVEPWAAGTDPDELERLVAYWADGYDWRHWEAVINALPSQYAEIGGTQLHYLRFDADASGAIPILLTNGWPSTFFEMVELAQRLATPERFGDVGEPAFTVIVPSLPGFTFSSQRPTLPADVATHELWHRLMSDELGFDRYVAHGGDLGAGTTSRLAAAHPEALLGVHLMAIGAPLEIDESSLTGEEQGYLSRIAEWNRAEGGYMHQQSTRPLSLAYGLSDSPTGLLAWILDKYRAWSDSGGLLSNSFTDDFLLTQASLYWFTNTIGTSFRPYYEYGRGVTRGLESVPVPTAVSLFPADISQPPRSWAERTHHVVRYEHLPRGGHFAPVETPGLLAGDIRRFVSSLSP